MFTCICHTEGCANLDIPINLVLEFADENGDLVRVNQVICGSCGEPITDVTVAEAEPTDA